VAEVIRHRLHGKPVKPFHYFDKGNFAVIGRGAAVGHFRDKLNLKGFLAWLAWLFIHLFFLIGFRNRVLVLVDWAYQYLTFRQGARLITGNSTIDVRSAGPPAPAPAPAPSPSPTSTAPLAPAPASASAGTAAGG
jgi:NADH dehydrogenase